MRKVFKILPNKHTGRVFNSKDTGGVIAQLNVQQEYFMFQSILLENNTTVGHTVTKANIKL